MGYFFGPLGNFFQESRFPDLQTPLAPAPAPPSLAPPDEFSDPNLTPLPTHPGIKYVARALAAMNIVTDMVNGSLRSLQKIPTALAAYTLAF